MRIIRSIGEWLAAAADWFLNWLGRLPSTNARIFTSLVLAIATGIRVLYTWTAPPWEWLLFLGAMMGLDLAQFATKRVTAGRNGQGGGGSGNGATRPTEERPVPAEAV